MIKAVAAGAALTKADTMEVVRSHTVVAITLGTDATATEPFDPGSDVRVVFSPLPGTTETPAITDGVVVTQEKDPARVLVVLTPDGLATYNNLAGRARVDVVAA